MHKSGLINQAKRLYSAIKYERQAHSRQDTKQTKANKKHGQGTTKKEEWTGYADKDQANQANL